MTPWWRSYATPCADISTPRTSDDLAPCRPCRHHHLFGGAFFVWLLNGLVLLIGGQLFFLFWFLPVAYAIFQSFFHRPNHDPQKLAQLQGLRQFSCFVEISHESLTASQLLLLATIAEEPGTLNAN